MNNHKKAQQTSQEPHEHSSWLSNAWILVGEHMRTLDPLLDLIAWLIIRLTMTKHYKHAMTVLHRVFG